MRRHARYREFLKFIPDDETALRVWGMAYFGHPEKCPEMGCSKEMLWDLKTRTYTCRLHRPPKTYSLRSRPPFRKSRLNPRKLFEAWYLLDVKRKDYKDLQRQLQVSRRTAWKIARRLRNMGGEFSFYAVIDQYLVKWIRRGMS